jgi:hypothetical protein
MTPTTRPPTFNKAGSYATDQDHKNKSTHGSSNLFVLFGSGGSAMTLSPLSPAFKEAHDDGYGAAEEKNVHGSSLFFEFMDAILDAPVVGMHVGQLRAHRIDAEFGRLDALFHAAKDFHHHRQVLAQAADLGQYTVQLPSHEIQINVRHAPHIDEVRLYINA